MTEEAKDTITIGEDTYVIDDLPDEGKYCVAQLKDLQMQGANLRAKMDQLAMSESGFFNKLKDVLSTLNN